jgi:hypothetical protein
MLDKRLEEMEENALELATMLELLKSMRTDGYGREEVDA